MAWDEEVAMLTAYRDKTMTIDAPRAHRTGARPGARAPIRVRLFEAPPLNGQQTRYHLALERLLPLPGDEEFDLTVRDREARKRKENLSRRRPDVVPVLLSEGHVEDGQRLWVTESALPKYARPRYDPDDPVFQVCIEMSAGVPKFKWQPKDDADAELVAPSATIHRVLEYLFPDRDDAGSPADLRSLRVAQH